MKRTIMMTAMTMLRFIVASRYVGVFGWRASWFFLSRFDVKVWWMALKGDEFSGLSG